MGWEVDRAESAFGVLPRSGSTPDADQQSCKTERQSNA